MQRKILIATVFLAHASVATAEFDYSDNHLHRSDELVRFDRAYRAGLSDGTTTIIYDSSYGGDDIGSRFELCCESSDRTGESSRPDGAYHVDRRPESDSVFGSDLAEKQAVPRGKPVPKSKPVQSDPKGTKTNPTNNRKAPIPGKTPDKSGAPGSTATGQPSSSTGGDSLPRNPSSKEDFSEHGDFSAPGADPRSFMPEPQAKPKTKSVPSQKPAPSPANESEAKGKQSIAKKSSAAGKPVTAKSAAPEPAARAAVTTAKQSTPSSNIPGAPARADRLSLGDSKANAQENAFSPLTPNELDPDFVRNQKVSLEIPEGSIEDIAKQVMPRGWRVRFISKQPDLKNQLFEFISAEPRDIALRELVQGTGLGFKYFFELKDKAGNPAPLLLISDSNS